MDLFLTSEKNAQTLQEIKRVIVEMKKASMRLTEDETNALVDQPFYKSLEPLLKELREIGLLEANGNVSYSGIMEVDYLLDIIKSIRSQHGPASNFEIGEPSLNAIIYGIQSTNIPLRVFTTNGSAKRYYVTFYTLENALEHLMKLAYTPDEDVALETFHHLYTFASQNGVFDTRSLEITIPDAFPLPVDTKNILEDLIEAFKRDAQIKREFQETFEYGPDDEDFASYEAYENFQERYDYIVLDEFMKARLKRKLKSFNFQLSIDAEVASIHTAEDFVFKVLNKLSVDDHYISVFKYLLDYLVMNEYFIKDNEYLVYAPTHSSWDVLVILAVEENLFGPYALAYKNGEEFASKDFAKTNRIFDIARVREAIAVNFKDNPVQ